MTQAEFNQTMITWLKHVIEEEQKNMESVEFEAAKKYFEGRRDQARNTLNLFRDLHVEQS